jgi:hypothetical protein
MKEPKKVKEVSFYPSLDMETRSRETQYAVATVHSKMTPRLDGKRQCKGTERLGDFFSGKKTLATSQDKVNIINDINPIEKDGIELFEDDDDEVDELEEYYQHKEQCAINRASMVRGKNSMVPEGTAAEAADYGNAQDVESHNSLNSSSNGEQDKKKRRTAKSYFTAEEPIEESKTQSKQLSTQELPSDAPPRPITKRAMVVRQLHIDKVGNKKAYKKADSLLPIEPAPDAGHNSALFYGLVRKMKSCSTSS